MRSKCKALWLLVTASAAVLGGAVAVAEDRDPTAMITGTATYRERMALPPGAVLEVTLEDISRANAPAVVIGRTRIESPGSPPFPFSIAFDPARVQVNHRYAVRARITLNDQLLFTTDTVQPVPGASDRTSVDLILHRAGSGASDASLENTYWKLVQLNGAPVEVFERQREAHLILQPAQHRLAGSGGCNRLQGSYRLEANKLSFGQVAATHMACRQGMEQERKFLDTLARVGRWAITGERLELFDASGVLLAQFDSVYLR
jgi:putative lipoprotein